MHFHTLEIALMTIDDLDEVLSIEKDSFLIPWTRNMFLSELEMDISRHFVAKVDMNLTTIIAGYLVYWIVAGEIQIQRIATKSEMRGLGIASRLMEKMIENSTMDGCDRCTLEVARSNERAIRFYEKYHLTVQGVRPRYYSDTEDALIMGSALRTCMGKSMYEH